MKDYKNTEDTPVGSNAGISRRDFVMTRLSIVLIVGLFVDSLPASAQGTVSDYARAITLRDRYQGLAINVPEQVQWIRNTNRFWYRKSVRDGTTFVLVDADTQAKAPAFDHTRLAEALSTAMGGKYTAVTLPFTTFTFVDDDRAIEFSPGGPTPAAPSGLAKEQHRGHFRVQPARSSGRSKAFHDVAWKNIKDAGFPDRILWHKAAAAKYPYYDITRVGIYGTSAGGQNSLGALLFHPEFYKVAVSFAGCHDNRMDKIWWNEQWMGWPIGPEYAESSNVENAYRLQGKVLLVVGEMDHNVDPSSTMQVVNQLIKHNKDFDLLVVPGMDHGSGGAFGDHKRYDFFVRNLLGVNPPSWVAVEETLKPQVKSTSATSGK